MKTIFSFSIITLFLLSSMAVAQEKSDNVAKGKQTQEKIIVSKHKAFTDTTASTENVYQKQIKPVQKNSLPSRSVHRARRINNTIIVDKANRKTQKKRHNPKYPNR